MYFVVVRTTTVYWYEFLLKTTQSQLNDLDKSRFKVLKGLATEILLYEFIFPDVSWCFVGMILPGVTVKIPFIFKSPNAGIFMETWRLETNIALCGGRTIDICLHGIATKEDEYMNQRAEIEVIVFPTHPTPSAHTKHASYFFNPVHQTLKVSAMFSKSLFSSSIVELIKNFNFPIIH